MKHVLLLEDDADVSSVLIRLLEEENITLARRLVSIMRERFSKRVKLTCSLPISFCLTGRPSRRSISPNNAKCRVSPLQAASRTWRNLKSTVNFTYRTIQDCLLHGRGARSHRPGERRGAELTLQLRRAEAGGCARLTALPRHDPLLHVLPED
jgi:hypothetical protein